MNGWRGVAVGFVTGAGVAATAGVDCCALAGTPGELARPQERGWRGRAIGALPRAGRARPGRAAFASAEWPKFFLRAETRAVPVAGKFFRASSIEGELTTGRRAATFKRAGGSSENVPAPLLVV